MPIGSKGQGSTLLVWVLSEAVAERNEIVKVDREPLEWLALAYVWQYDYDISTRIESTV